MRSTRLLRRLMLLLALALFATSCTQVHVYFLAGDVADGRQNDTPGSTWSQSYIVNYLRQFAEALDGTTDHDAYRSPMNGGTNLIGVIRGADPALADEYVVVGAHYDHVGHNCRTADPADTICNGATDNAAGVAIVLEVARALAESSPPPARSVILAFWDREEDGLLGSGEWVQDPASPIDDVVAYVNFDIQGANLLPSLRDTSIVVGAESGGATLDSLLDAAIATEPLDTQKLSATFGQGRSDYVHFLNAGIPSVFFSDSTGPCYHTAQDEYDVVDQGKLQEQTGIALELTRSLASDTAPPTFVAGAPAATFDDAVVLLGLVTAAAPDLGMFTPAQQATMLGIEADLTAIITDGAAAFGADDIGATLVSALNLVSLLTAGECDGYLE